MSDGDVKPPKPAVVRFILVPPASNVAVWRVLDSF